MSPDFWWGVAFGVATCMPIIVRLWQRARTAQQIVDEAQFWLPQLRAAEMRLMMGQNMGGDPDLMLKKKPEE